ncbi:hypothetical protein [Streptomyces rishiriensis]|uniref:Uncharacterized protein n=1 Tax=Streptomyces rishiriensis TaxID=68264 RepID=A0ABU0P374_STRRH|nr:hypothetical protein [Streptomyces rishiriensis]MDQ0585857.1 hypothetical protein [Streptomyces rishiriensis]
MLRARPLRGGSSVPQGRITDGSRRTVRGAAVTGGPVTGATTAARVTVP